MSRTVTQTRSKTAIVDDSGDDDYTPGSDDLSALAHDFAELERQYTVQDGRMHKIETNLVIWQRRKSVIELYYNKIKEMYENAIKSQQQRLNAKEQEQLIHEWEFQ
jgi:hypothetical protein